MDFFYFKCFVKTPVRYCYKWSQQWTPQEKVHTITHLKIVIASRKTISIPENCQIERRQLGLCAIDTDVRHGYKSSGSIGKQSAVKLTITHYII